MVDSLGTSVTVSVLPHREQGSLDLDRKVKRMTTNTMIAEIKYSINPL